MRHLLAILALVAVAAGVPVHPMAGIQRLITGRIVGGEDTVIEKAPYQVSVQVFGRHNCGGSIVSSSWILTAAHCTSRPVMFYKIRVGSTFNGFGGQLYDVEQIIVHESYGQSSKGVPVHDIALIKLKTPLEFNERVQPIGLFDDVLEVGSMGTVTGWGETGRGKVLQLQVVQVPILAKEECMEAYKKMGGIPVGQICAALPEGGKDSCQGDSGGPMIQNGQQIGIVSWGIGCAQPGYPGVYVEVAAYHQWILDNTRI